GLFETGDEAIELAFRYAVDRINADNAILPQSRLSTKVERLEKCDSFVASKKALIRVQEILKDPDLRDKRIVVRQFDTDEYRRVFKEVGKLGIKNIIVDVSRDHIHLVLKHAQQVDMLSEYHNYFFTTLDLQTVDLEDFQYAGTNISAFSLVDQSSKEYQEIVREWQSNSFSNPRGAGSWKNDPSDMRTEVALMYDSVKLLAKTLHDLDRSQPINVKPLSCDSEDPWQYGITLTNYMRMITVKGLTGDIKFDDNGLRTDVKLKLLELTREGLRAVGDWTLTKQVEFMKNYSKQMAQEYLQTLQNKTLTVVTNLGKPYSMFVEDWEEKGLTGNDRFEGYCIDLITEIAKSLKFKFVIKLVEDRAHGKRNEKGEWNGMIRELIDGDHIFVELMRELKHVICCYGSTRPVRKNMISDMGSQVMLPPPGNGLPFMPISARSNIIPAPPQPISERYQSEYNTQYNQEQHYQGQTPAGFISRPNSNIGFRDGPPDGNPSYCRYSHEDGSSDV
ncbi:glutamate receptor: ionotropic kainate 2-like protein 3, partial [Dinothrombium tinctorium]